MIVKTFLHVDQNQYLPGEKILEKKKDMRQKIIIVNSEKDVKNIDLDDLIEGFPLSVNFVISTI